MQPAEFVINFGAAIGTVLIANPLPVVMKMLKGIAGAFGSSRFSRTFYLETLKMLNEVFVHARKSGMALLEAHVEEPTKSEVFGKYKDFLKDPHAVHFVCDTLRMAITGASARSNSTR